MFSDAGISVQPWGNSCPIDGAIAVQQKGESMFGSLGNECSIKGGIGVQLMGDYTGGLEKV